MDDSVIRHIAHGVLQRVEVFTSLDDIAVIEVGGSFGYGCPRERSDVDVFIYPHEMTDANKFGFGYRDHVGGQVRKVGTILRPRWMYDIVKVMDVRRWEIHPELRLMGSKSFPDKDNFWREYNSLLMEKG